MGGEEGRGKERRGEEGRGGEGRRKDSTRIRKCLLSFLMSVHFPAVRSLVHPMLYLDGTSLLN